jgi:hypothetical protein
MTRVFLWLFVMASCYCVPSYAKESHRLGLGPWQEVVVSVTDIDRTAQFFKQIGGYVAHAEGVLSSSELESWGLREPASGRYMVLGPEGASAGFIRLIDFDSAGPQKPMRPGARAWDTGCYFSIMVRVKGIESIYDEAIRMGWWTETPIAPLQFGDSDLRIVIFKGPDGIQIQSYERLSPELPEAVGPFDRMTRPFNVMQMVESQPDAYRFFTDILEFATYYTGPPVTAPAPVISPIGIPWSLTTHAGYQAGIVYPTPGEYGRMEMIQVHGMEGQDYRDRCVAPNLGILAVRFMSDQVAALKKHLQQHDVAISSYESVDLSDLGVGNLLQIKSPDGAIIQFIQAQ